MDVRVFDDVSATAQAVAITVFWMSICVMISVEALKYLLRARFHKQCFSRWINEIENDNSTEQVWLFLQPFEAEKAQRFFGKHVLNAFRLPRKLFMRRVETAVQTALDYPEYFRERLTNLAHSIPAEEREHAIDALIAARGGSEWTELAAKVTTAVERTLDTFQLSMSQLWLDSVRLLSVILGSIIGLIFYSLAESGASLNWIYWMLLGAGSGAFAMLFHDILARLAGTGTERV